MAHSPAEWALEMPSRDLGHCRLLGLPLGGAGPEGREGKRTLASVQPPRRITGE